MTTATDPRLAARRRAIHAAARQLQLPEEDRRALIAGQCAGKTSTTELNLAECDQVLTRLRALGAERPRADSERYVGRHPGYPETCRPGCVARLEKIEAQLADMQLPWEYARVILTHVSKPGQGKGVDRLEWAKAEHLDKVIAALDYEQIKRARLEEIDRQLAARGLDRTWVEAMLTEQAPHYTPKWTRNTRALGFVLDVLGTR